MIFSLDKFATVLAQIGDDESAQAARELVARLGRGGPEDVKPAIGATWWPCSTTFMPTQRARHNSRGEALRPQGAAARAMAGWTLAKDGSQTDSPGSGRS